jgi:predicted P-loop ATPase
MSLENPQTAVAHLHGEVRFDREVESYLSAQGITIRRNLLADAIEVHRGNTIVPLTDERLAEIRFSFVFARNGREPAKEKIADALLLIGERRAYHPVADYLAGLEWDGAPRIDRWLIDFAGAEDTDLNRAIGRKILCAAVRRVRKPGCKFDTVPVLIGRQGTKKSTLVRALCPSDVWFSDQVKVGADARETIERAAGAWIVELAELDGLNKREANATKSFITTVMDKARPAYGRYAVERARQFVLFGTTNEEAFLTDTTGNRRWWPVTVTECDPDGLADVRDHLWAEAVAMERDEALWLDTEELRANAEIATEAASDHGPWFELLEAKLPAGPLKITATDAWLLVGIGQNEINRLSVQHRGLMGRALNGLGFDPKSRTLRRDGVPIKAFVRGDTHTADWWSAPSSHETEPDYFRDF